MEEKCILDPQKECLGLMRAELLEREMSDLKKDIEDIRERNNSSHSEFYNRLMILEKHNEAQDIHYEHIIEKLGDITTKLNSVVEKIAAIESKPGKKWENMVSQIFGLVLAAIVAVVFTKIGLK